MSKNVQTAYYDFANMGELMQRLGLTGRVITYRQMIGFIEPHMSMFSYDGLPDDLPPWVLRWALMFRNKLCFYNHPLYGIVLCTYLPTSVRNLYWIPEYVDLLALNGKTIATKVPFKDLVLVKDNKLDLPPFLWLMEYFDKMNNIENTLMKNVDLLKLPAIFTGNEKTVTSFNNIINKALGFKPFAVTDKMIAESFKQFDVKLPVSLEEQMSLYKNYKNMALESIGISGTETQKKERLLVSEVESQSEYKNLNYTDFKNCQLDWIDEYEKKFNKKVTLIENLVDYRETEIELTAEEAKQVAEAEAKAGGDEDVRL